VKRSSDARVVHRPNRIAFLLAVTVLVAPWTSSAKKAPDPISVTFEAHNEGTDEIYGEENLVTMTIDSAGIRYQGKGMDKPYVMTWEQIGGWQPNIFNSVSPKHASGGDFGIGIYQARYFNFRTHNGADFLAAVKILRKYAAAKERKGQ
jgi:hypothetical protein